MVFLRKKNLLVKQQSGFRNKRGTSDNLFFFTQKVSESLCKGKKVCSIFFDISKAFDKVWHAGLLFKLDRLGIPRYLIKFIQSFLRNRYCRIKMKNTMGDLIPIQCGVPQGSVLGPILFLVFINDIPLMDLKHISYSSLFADDLATFFIFNKKRSITSKMNMYLESLVEWLFKWRLKMNAKKCCYTIFSKNGNKNSICFNLKLKDGLIPYNAKPVFLGVTFDEFLCFNEHFNNLRLRALKKLNIIKILRHRSWGLSCLTLKSVYNALVGSIFGYSFFTVANVSAQNLNKIQIVQNRAIRCIFRLDWNSLTHELTKISGVLSIRNRFIQLGCRCITKSIKYNFNTGTLIQEYLCSISSIKRKGGTSTPLCVIYPYIALVFALWVFICVSNLCLIL